MTLTPPTPIHEFPVVEQRKLENPPAGRMVNDTLVKISILKLKIK